ncbi:HpcH/HpaI aldolase/citrate lyase family protein [Nocardia sp. 348MFTsu5.1]|uniref:HpcH/HpaI aldolase/citrate lyase family protein n=1 Tax=Nocardia sp. 348MFTsu5.1 TaxID=1172185 RepID=UPI00037C6A12|nr:HpcH/HpaI aldolase/citrate lyase family protein [Nocardia sp. 348MFTsu5.1]
MIKQAISGGESGHREQADEQQPNNGESSSDTANIQHFAALDEAERERLFHRFPETIDVDSTPELLSVAIGATLYIPAIRDRLPELILRQGRNGSTSMVIDLEDAIADHQVAAAMTNLVAALDDLADQAAGVPLLFVRVRTAEQIDELLGRLDRGIEILAGFVLPKFTAVSGEGYLNRIDGAIADSGRMLYAMPIIESTEVLHLESRMQALSSIRDLLGKHREKILAVRIGATDMCGAFGIRRDPDLTIYDVQPVAEVIGAIVNVLGRTDGTGFTITGPVWEYYNTHDRMFRPLLRHTPFEQIDAVRFRTHLVSRDLDGLLRELVLDHANGLQGKTVIHPSHVNVVHAMSAVSHEEYVDAVAILGVDDSGGVEPSAYRNKMNERRPHRNWADKTLVRAQAFGVLQPEIGVVDLLASVVEP